MVFTPTHIAFQPSLPLRTIHNPSLRSQSPPLCSLSPKSSSKPSIETLKSDYKSKKAAYKNAKALYKATKKGIELQPQVQPQQQQQIPLKPIENNNTLPSTIQICGSVSCRRRGADAVARMLTPGEPPNSDCMKMCGGVGPTICIDGVKVKVDFKTAVMQAVQQGNQQDDE